MNLEEQMEECKDRLELARDGGDDKSAAEALCGMARIYSQKKAWDAAGECWGEAESLFRKINLESELAQTLLDLGHLAEILERKDLGAGRYQEALILFTKTKHHQGMAKTLDRLGGLALQESNLDTALQVFQQGLDLCLDQGDKIGGLYFLDQVIPILKAKGLAGDVEQAYRKWVTLAEGIWDRERMALGLVGLADVYSRTNRPQEALPCLEMAHDLYLRLGKERETGLVADEIAKLRRLTGEEEDRAG